MRTDTIFYQLFQTFDTLLFELLNQPVQAGYQFILVEVKEKAFRFDGVFAPEIKDLPIYFLEVQFQQKLDFYFGFLSEIMLYLYQYQPLNDWRAVAIFPQKATEPLILTKFQQELIDSQRIIPIYLDQLADSQSIGIKIIQLITICPKDAPQLVQIVQSLKQQDLSRDIIELIETVLVYKFTNLTYQEIEAMFTLSDLKKTRVYQDASQEGEQEGEQKGKQEGKQEVALNLLSSGMGINQVASLTGLTTEQLNQALDQKSQLFHQT